MLWCHNNEIHILVTLRPTTKFHCYSIKTLKECALTVLLLCNNDADDRDRCLYNNNNNNNNNRQGSIYVTPIQVVDHNKRYYIEDKAFHTIIYTNAWKQGKKQPYYIICLSFNQ